MQSPTIESLNNDTIDTADLVPRPLDSSRKPKSAPSSSMDSPPGFPKKNAKPIAVGENQLSVPSRRAVLPQRQKASSGPGDIDGTPHTSHELDDFEELASPALAPHHMTFLSPATREAYEGLKQAKKAYKANRDDPVVADTYVSALAKWVTEATADIRWLTSGPRRLTDPNVRATLVNMLTQFINNQITFTLATAVSGLLSHHMSEAGSLAVNSGMITFMQAFASDFAPFVGRQLHGSESELRFSLGDHANNGQYTKTACGVALTLLAVIIHGSAHLITTASADVFHNSVGGKIARSAVSGIAMSVGTQSLLSTGAAITKRRLGISEAKYKPETQHTRKDPNGIDQYSYGPMSERATPAFGAEQILLRSVSSAVGGALLFGINVGVNEQYKDAPLKNSAASILGAYSAMFVTMGMIQMLGSLMFFDTKRHIARYGKVSNEILIQQIRDSSTKGTRALLSNASVAMEKGLLGETSRLEMTEATNVLSGEAYRTVRKGNTTSDEFDNVIGHLRGSQIDSVTGRLRMLADDIEKTANEGLPEGAPSGLIDSTLLEVAHNLRIAGDDLEIARKNYIENDNGVLYPELSDANNRLRDITALLTQAITQMGGANHVALDPRIAKVTMAVLPMLAAVNKVDRMGVARSVADTLVSIAREQDRAAHRSFARRALSAMFDNSPKEMLGTLSGLLGNRGVSDETVSLINRTGDNKDYIRQTLDGLLADNFGGSPDALSDLSPLLKDDGAVRLLILLNKLGPSDRPDASPATTLNSHIAAYNALGGTVGTETPAAVVKNFVQAFRRSDFTLDELKTRVLDQLGDGTAPADDGLTAGGVNAFKKLVGAKFADTALYEHQPPVDTDPTVLATGMVNTVWKDMEAKPASRKEAIKAAMSLPVLQVIEDVPMHFQSDIHAHLTNYNGIITSMARQAMENRANHVVRQLNAAIPHQVPNSSADKKYYSVINRLMDYVNRDYSLAQGWLRMNNDSRMRVLELVVKYSNNPAENIEVTSTGGDPTDINSEKRELAHLQRAFEGTGLDIKAVGETTLDKEQVKRLTPRRIRVENESSVATLNSSIDAGKMFLLHADGGSSHLNKTSNDGSLEQLYRDIQITQNFPSADPIKSQPGLEHLADRYAIIVHAHAPGLAKTISERNDHCRYINRRMIEVNRAFGDKGEMNVDLSWDFIAQAILEGQFDYLIKLGLAPAIQQGLQDLLKSYRSFDVVGAPADKSGDLGVTDQEAEGRVGSNAIAGLHMQALAAFKMTVERAFRDPATRTRLIAMMKQKPEDQVGEGNNWLGFIFHQKNNLLYGSDTLAPGIKSHGQRAYMINARMYEFVYVMFDAAAKYDKDFEGVSRLLGTDNFERVVDDPRTEARRAAYSEHIGEGGGEWGSGNIRPDQRAIPADLPDHAQVRPNKQLVAGFRRVETRGG